MTKTSLLESKLSGAKVALAIGALCISTALASCMSPILPQARREVRVEYAGPSIEEVKAGTIGNMSYAVVDGKETPQAEGYFTNGNNQNTLLEKVMMYNDQCVAATPKFGNQWSVYRADAVRAVQGSGSIVLDNSNSGLRIGIDGKGTKWVRSGRKIVRVSDEQLLNGQLDSSEAIPNYCEATVTGDEGIRLYSFPNIAGKATFSYDALKQQLDSLHKNQGGQ
jgi:hypothetical protein